MTRQSSLILSSILLLFFFSIQLQNPGQAFSGEEPPAASAIDNEILDQSSGNGVIGQIQTRNKVIIIRSGADGQIYTVKSKEGDILADDLNAEELNAKFPELKEVVENGLAGDASVRMNNTSDHKVTVTIQDVPKK